MTKDSRGSMVRSAAALIGSRGVSATSFSDVLADSGAPRGSIYHHFPDGKDQLVQDAVTWTSDRVLAYQRANAGASATDVLETFIGLWRQVVNSSGGASGCVVAGVAIDTDAREPGLIDVVRDTFRSWIALLSEQLRAAGLRSERATAIATATLAGLEGALILCRAEGNSGPLELVAGELIRLVAAEDSSDK